MESHEIISVKVVLGKSLHPNWKRNMQVIQTDQGLYIDNIEGNQFGFFKDAAPGFNWAPFVGKTVNDIKIYNAQGYQWLNKKAQPSSPGFRELDPDSAPF